MHSLLILLAQLWQLGHHAAQNPKVTCTLSRMEFWTGIQVSGIGKEKEVSRKNKEFQILGLERQFSG